jgi:hypothetical protein
MDEMDDFEYGTDPYDSIPFGDAQRFEDEQVARDLDAGEGQPDYDDTPEVWPEVRLWAEAEAASAARHGGRLLTERLAYALNERHRHETLREWAGSRDQLVVNKFWRYNMDPADQPSKDGWKSMAEGYANGQGLHRNAIITERAAEAMFSWPIYQAAFR